MMCANNTFLIKVKKIKRFLVVCENLEIIKIISSLFVGVIILVAFNVIGNKIVGPIRCEDGWSSTSIGRQGACSHHGGVNTTPRDTILFLSLIFSAGSGVYFASFFKKLERDCISETEIKKMQESLISVWQKVYNQKPQKELVDMFNGGIKGVKYL